MVSARACGRQHQTNHCSTHKDSDPAWQRSATSAALLQRTKEAAGLLCPCADTHRSISSHTAPPGGTRS